MSILLKIIRRRLNVEKCRLKIALFKEIYSTGIFHDNPTLILMSSCTEMSKSHFLHIEKIIEEIEQQRYSYLDLV